MPLPALPILQKPDALGPTPASSSGPSLPRYPEDQGYPADALLERVRDDFPVPTDIQWDEVL